MIQVWRMNIHTHEGREKQKEAFKFCLELGILGIGWKTKTSIFDGNIDDEYQHSKIAFNRVVNAIRAVKKDDLIWTRSGNVYYLCRVLGEKIDYFKDKLSILQQEKHEINDIWHGIKCEIIKVGTQEKIYGSIVDSFNVGTICKIRKNTDAVLNFSMGLYNQLTNSNFYVVESVNTWDKFWSSIHNSQLEELVTLFLQCEYNLCVYTNTCKKTTKTYECVLFDRKNQKPAYVQVKRGGININQEDYVELAQKNKFFFFSENGDYGSYTPNKNIEIITKEQLQKFIKENLEIIKNVEGFGSINEILFEI